MPAPYHSVFTGQMPFLPQRQSIEGIGANATALTLVAITGQTDRWTDK